MITNLLSSHRRNRHQKLMPTMSPASAIASGNLTPYSNQQLYAKLSFKDQSQLTSNALEHMNGDYHWSRSDQTYFDVTCPALPLQMGKSRMLKQKAKSHSSAPSLTTSSSPKSKLQTTSSSSAPSLISSSLKSATNTTVQPKQHQQQQQQRSNKNKRTLPPILQISIYSKTNNNNASKWGSDKKKNADYLIGKCSINVLRILSGKTPYFDEWVSIHNDSQQQQHHKNNKKGGDQDEAAAGRVRIVIEYEPTDPPPRPGDICTFANVYPLVEEMYPIPLHSIIQHKSTFRGPVRASTSMSTLSTTSLSSSACTPSTAYNNTSTTITQCYPKTYIVEEVVGDHIVLSYTTPIENWTCTFEVHRYLLLCIERHQATVEKYKERVLDLCDNISQSPAMEVITKTVETLPDEGLVYVGAELLGGSVDLLGRWWEVGVDGIVEDVVDGINLDGRYSHYSDEEVEENDVGNDSAEVSNSLQHEQYTSMASQPSSALDRSETSSSQVEERKALPGMPCCPITGQPMIDPVVAADGHTYERTAIARWLCTSNRSPLTGGILAHSELVPNYLLLSSYESKLQEDDEEYVDEATSGLLDVL